MYLNLYLRMTLVITSRPTFITSTLNILYTNLEGPFKGPRYYLGPSDPALPTCSEMTMSLGLKGPALLTKNLKLWKGTCWVQQIEAAEAGPSYGKPCAIALWFDLGTCNRPWCAFRRIAKQVLRCSSRTLLVCVHCIYRLTKCRTKKYFRNSSTRDASTILLSRTQDWSSAGLRFIRLLETRDYIQIKN